MNDLVISQQALVACSALESRNVPLPVFQPAPANRLLRAGLTHQRYMARSLGEYGATDTAPA